MSKEAKLGLFVLIVFGVFLFFTVNMGSGLFTGEKRTYPIYFKSTGTLEKGAPVKQAGYDVGEVIGIALKTIMEPTPNIYIIVDISVNKDAHIAFDSKASIQTMGMMGEKYVEVSFGELEEAPEGTRIDGQGPQALDQVMADANDLIKEIYKMVASLNVIFADTAFQQNITHLIANLEQFSREVTELLGGQEERLKNILANAQAASAHLNSMIATAELFVVDARNLVNENRPHIRKTLENTSAITQTLRDELPDNLNKLSKQLVSVSERLSHSIQNADQLISKLNTVMDENRPDIRETMTQIKDFSTNAKSASERVNHLIKQIDEGDGLVHNLIYDRDLSQSAKHTIVHASNTLGGFSNFGERFTWEIDSRYFTDRPRFDRDDNNARVDFGVYYAMTDNLSFYLGGNSLGSSNDLEAQMGYRFGAFTLHGGIIESEFGLGLDWQIYDRWKIGVEGVGLTDEDHERLDAYTEFMLWKHFYLVGGVQDLTDEAFPNIGMKLRF